MGSAKPFTFNGEKFCEGNEHWKIIMLIYVESKAFPVSCKSEVTVQCLSLDTGEFRLIMIFMTIEPYYIH